MVVTDQQKLAQFRKASGRKHPVMRSIVKNEGGSYEVATPVTPRHHVPNRDEVISDLRLQINTLTLNMNVLLKEMAILLERGTPFDGVTVPASVSHAVAKANREIKTDANVIPMRTRPTQTAEKATKSTVVPAPTPGNEAEVLLLPAPQSPSEKRADVEPKYVKKDNPVLSIVRSDKSEDTYIPGEVVKKLAEISDEDPVTMQDLAFQYGMDLVEASEILYREYARREKHCYHLHGKARSDLRLERHLLQDGYDLRQPPFKYHKSRDSNFSAWWAETEALMPMLRSRSMASQKKYERKASEVGLYSKLVPGEATYRDRERERLKQGMRKPKGTYAHVDTVARRLQTSGPGVTTGSQLAAFRSLSVEIRDRLRRVFGMKPILRSAKQRQEYQAEYDATRFEQLNTNLRDPTYTPRILRSGSQRWFHQTNRHKSVGAQLDQINAHIISSGKWADNEYDEVAGHEASIREHFEKYSWFDETVTDTK